MKFMISGYFAKIRELFCENLLTDRFNYVKMRLRTFDSKRVHRENGQNVRVTIKQIAEELGISHSTVSRVLNDKQPSLVGEATRERILQAAKRMGYRPSRIAQALQGKSTQLIGVFVPDTEDYFFQTVIKHLRHTLEESEYELMVFVSTPTPDHGKVASPAAMGFGRRVRVRLSVLCGWTLGRALAAFGADPARRGPVQQQHTIEGLRYRRLRACAERPPGAFARAGMPALRATWRFRPVFIPNEQRYAVFSEFVRAAWTATVRHSDSFWSPDPDGSGTAGIAAPGWRQGRRFPTRSFARTTRSRSEPIARCAKRASPFPIRSRWPAVMIYLMCLSGNAADVAFSSRAGGL